tara:strand:+ start:1617 stop:1820 length:204 start_codon:yes stop_codon:yes gene_type:complete
MNNVYKYSSYKEIPDTIESYIITVADVKMLEQVPLEDINSFLNGLEEFGRSQPPVDIEQMALEMDAS